MSHNINFTIEAEVLGRKKKERISSEIKLNDLTVIVGDRGMTISEHKIPFNSFVKNFGISLAKILGATITTGLKTPGSVSIAASTYMGVSEGAITSGYSKRGIWIGDKERNAINAGSIAAVSASTSRGWQTGNVGGTTGKSDIFLKRRIEAESTSLAANQKTKLEYGAVSFTVLNDNKFQIRRRFFNNRGASIKINEVGLATCLDDTLWVSKKAALLARDNFTYDLTLLDQQYLDVIYTIELPSTGYLNMNFLFMLANILRSNSGSYAQVHTMKNRYGDWLLPQGTADGYSVMALANDDELGLQVGSYEGSQSYYAYKLDSHLANAVMDRGAMGFLNEVNDGSTSTKFGFYRDFTNVSGLTQSIYEGGLAVPDGDTGVKSCYISYFPLNLTIDPNDVLRLKIYFEMPVTSNGVVLEDEVL